MILLTGFFYDILCEFFLILLSFHQIAEELTKVISVVNALSGSDEKATIDTISSHLSNEALNADRLVQILDEAISRGSVIKNSEDGSYQSTRSLRPHRLSTLVSNQSYAFYESHAPKRRRTMSSATTRNLKPANGDTSVCSLCILFLIQLQNHILYFQLQ